MPSLTMSNGRAEWSCPGSGIRETPDLMADENVPRLSRRLRELGAEEHHRPDGQRAGRKHDHDRRHRTAWAKREHHDGCQDRSEQGRAARGARNRWARHEE